jgi:hypothetical protein
MPRMIPVRQTFPAPTVADVAATVRTEVQQGCAAAGIKAGDSIAVGAGSRGIVNYDIICRETVQALQELGANPFIFPAMGSHGGATSTGQAAVLDHLGISQETMGCPIKSEIEPTQVGTTADGIPVWIDQHALSADHMVLVNRIKPHTDFRGAIESGIMKMGSVGLGKRLGASACHKAAMHFGFEHTIRTVAALVCNHRPLAFGLAILENGHEKTAQIEAIPGDRIEAREAELLEHAKGLQAKLPFDEVDLLIVDWMGKNLSGTGMDSNIVGRRMHTREPEMELPRITRLMVCNLTEESGGNATGIGFADFTTKRLVDRIDFETTYINSLTGLGPQKVRIPMHFDTDTRILEAAFSTIGMMTPDEACVVRVESTLQLEEVLISEAMADKIAARDDLTPSGSAIDMPFDDKGLLLPFADTVMSAKEGVYCH